LLVGDAGCGRSQLASSLVEVLDEGGLCPSVLVRYGETPSSDDGVRAALGDDPAAVGPADAARAALLARLDGGVGVLVVDDGPFARADDEGAKVLKALTEAQAR
jgi:hypothetical protein